MSFDEQLRDFCLLILLLHDQHKLNVLFLVLEFEQFDIENQS